MEQKNFYQLAAWTADERIELAPTCFYLAEEPYLDRIDELSQEGAGRPGDETGRIFRLSCAHEAYADFLLECGIPGEAFDAYVEAARVCLNGPKSRRGHDESLCRELRLRFYAVYDRCQAFARQRPKFRTATPMYELEECCRRIGGKIVGAGRCDPPHFY